MDKIMVAKVALPTCVQCRLEFHEGEGEQILFAEYRICIADFWYELCSMHMKCLYDQITLFKQYFG